MTSSHSQMQIPEKWQKNPGEFIKEFIRTRPDPVTLRCRELVEELEYCYAGLVGFIRAESASYSKPGAFSHLGKDAQALWKSRIAETDKILDQARMLADNKITPKDFQLFLEDIIERYLTGNLADKKQNVVGYPRDFFDKFIYKSVTMKAPNKWQWRAESHHKLMGGIGDHDFARLLAAVDRIVCRIDANLQAIAENAIKERAELDAIERRYLPRKEHKETKSEAKSEAISLASTTTAARPLSPSTATTIQAPPPPPPAGTTRLEIKSPPPPSSAPPQAAMALFHHQRQPTASGVSTTSVRKQSKE